MTDCTARYTILVPHDTPLAELEQERMSVLAAYAARGFELYPFYPLAAFLDGRPAAFWKNRITACGFAPPAVQGPFVFRPLVLHTAADRTAAVSLPPVRIGELIVPHGLIYAVNPDGGALPGGIYANEIKALSLRVCRLYEADIYCRAGQPSEIPVSLYWELGSPLWVKMSKPR